MCCIYKKIYFSKTCLEHDMNDDRDRPGALDSTTIVEKGNQRLLFILAEYHAMPCHAMTCLLFIMYYV